MVSTLLTVAGDAGVVDEMRQENQDEGEEGSEQGKGLVDPGTEHREGAGQDSESEVPAVRRMRGWFRPHDGRALPSR